MHLKCKPSQEIGFHTLSLMNTTYAYTIWDQSSTSYVRTPHILFHVCLISLFPSQQFQIYISKAKGDSCLSMGVTLPHSLVWGKDLCCPDVLLLPADQHCC